MLFAPLERLFQCRDLPIKIFDPPLPPLERALKRFDLLLTILDLLFAPVDFLTCRQNLFVFLLNQAVGIIQQDAAGLRKGFGRVRGDSNEIDREAFFIADKWNWEECADRGTEDS